MPSSSSSSSYDSEDERFMSYRAAWSYDSEDERKIHAAHLEVTQLMRLKREAWPYDSEEERDPKTAYHAAVDLMWSIQGFQKDTEYDTRILKSRVEFISNELSFLGPFLKTMRLMPRDATVDILLQSSVKDALKKLRVLTKSYIHCDESLTLELSEQLLKVKQEIILFSETVKSDEEYKRREQQSYSNFTSTTSAFISKKNIVGMHDQLSGLKDLVLKEFDNKDVIIVMGMTGIGKTALVQEIFKDPLVAELFDAYLFLHFGPRYQIKEILLLALHQLGVHSDKFHENDSVEQLQNCLKESLYGLRCLVVLDEVWNSDRAIQKLYSYFPSVEEVSNCVIMTAQHQYLIFPFGYTRFRIRFLNDNESWNLLRETVFTSEEEWCIDRQLEKVGKKIAKKCEGLPLAIIQVGELLKGKNIQEWKTIAEKEDPLTITTEDDTPLSNGVSLSYNMLRQNLKELFLYMGVFPKKYEITRSKLVKLFASEGLHEELPEFFIGDWLDKLVRASCVLEEKVSSNHSMQTKSCKLHFTFRSLCVSEAKRNKFFHIIRKLEDCFPENIDSEEQRLCIHNNVVLGFEQVHEWMESAPDVSSFLCFGPNQQYPIVLYLPFRSLKVLDVLAIRFYEFPDQVLDLFELKYFAITCDDEELPPSISRLHKLEVFIFRPYHDIIKPCVRYLPVEIWKLSKLRHLRCLGFDVPDPSSLDDDSLILGRLSSLVGVSAHSCTPEVLSRMPILKKIGTRIINTVETGVGLVGDVTSLYKEFHSLKCDLIYPNLLKSRVIPSFPKHVLKITLSGFALPWEFMRVIEALPNLIVLKLRCNAFSGPEWKSYDVNYNLSRLQYLLLEDLDLQHWEANSRHFRDLTRLVVRHCYKLQQFPKGFESIESLEMIEVDDCNQSAVLSIQRIEERRKTLDRNKLQVRVHCSWDDK